MEPPEEVKPDTAATVTTAPTTSSDAATKPSDSEAAKGKSTLHGSSYHLRLGMMILFRAYHLHRAGKLSKDFEITMEDPSAGKFDDVVFRYSSEQLKEEGIVYIQAKHKQTTGNSDATTSTSATTTDKKTSQTTGDSELIHPSLITKDELLKHWNCKAQFSVSMYFASYLETHQNFSPGKLDRAHTYMLCTNAKIDDEIMQYFKQRESHVDHILHFSEEIKAKCYSFIYAKVVSMLIEESRKASVEKLGQTWATYVKNGKEIKSTVALFGVHKKLIAECVEPLGLGQYKFRQAFFTATTSTVMGKVQQAFSDEYFKLLLEDKENVECYSDLNKKEIIIEDGFFDTDDSDTAGDSYYEKVDQAFQTFCEQFVIVCDSLNENELIDMTAKRMPNWVQDGVATNSALFVVLFGSMKDTKENTINFHILRRKFGELMAKDIVSGLAEKSKKSFALWQEEYQNVFVKPERLEQLALYGFIDDKPRHDIMQFCSAANMKMTSLVVSQILNLVDSKCLYVDTRNHHELQTSLVSLKEITEYVSDVDPLNTNIIALLGKMNKKARQELKHLAKEYRMKIILIEKLDKDELSIDNLYVYDLTDESRTKLFGGDITIQPYGTSVAVTDILKPKEDSLSFLSQMLTKFDEPVDPENDYSNSRQFDFIKPWYVSRTIVPCTAQTLEQVQEDFNTSLVYPSNLSNLRFSEISILEKEIVQNQEPITSSEDQSVSVPVALNVNESNGKIFTFLDEAGSGKSAYFKWLSCMLPTTDKALYAVRVEVLKHAATFARYSRTLDKIDDSTTVMILYRLLYGLQFMIKPTTSTETARSYLENKQLDKIVQLLEFSDGKIKLDNDKIKAADLTASQLLEIRLFQIKFNERKVIVMLDGLDIIHPHFTKFGMKYVTQLANLKGIHSVCVSSRPYNKMDKLIKSFFDCKMFRLKPLYQRDQIRYWKNCIEQHMQHPKSCTKNECLKGAAIIHNAIVDNFRELYRLPLFLRVSYTFYLPMFKECINFQQQTVSKDLFRQAKVFTVKLFDQFIDEKLKILNIERAATEDSITDNPIHQIKNIETNEQLKRKHGLLALQTLFGANITHTLLHGEDRDGAKVIWQEVFNGTEKTGLAPRISEHGIPVFTHQVLVDFFISYWMYVNKDRIKNEDLFWSRLFWNRERRQMRIYFDRLVVGEADRCAIHHAVVNQAVYQVQELLAHDVKVAFHTDSGGRLPLHLAIVYSMEDYLLTNELRVETLNVKDKLYGWSALDYAFIMGFKTTIEKLISYGAAVNESVLLRQILSNSEHGLIKDLLLSATNYGEWLLPHENSDALVTKLHSGVVQYLINDWPCDILARHEELDSQTVLEYCIKQDMVGVFKQCILQLNDPSKITHKEYSQLLELATKCKSHNIISCFIEQ